MTDSPRQIEPSSAAVPEFSVTNRRKSTPVPFTVNNTVGLLEALLFMVTVELIVPVIEGENKISNVAELPPATDNTVALVVKSVLPETEMLVTFNVEELAFVTVNVCVAVFPTNTSPKLVVPVTDID